MLTRTWQRTPRTIAVFAVVGLVVQLGAADGRLPAFGPETDPFAVVAPQKLDKLGPMEPFGVPIAVPAADEGDL